MEKVHPACRICDTSLSDSDKKGAVTHRFQDSMLAYDLYFCPQCSFGFWWPMTPPPVEFYERMYANFTWLDDRPKSDDAALFLRYVPLRGGRLLDVGCGHGAFLGPMRELGFELWGVDIIQEAIEKAKKLFGLQNLYVASFYDFAAREDLPQFDIITFFNVLEHIGDPKVVFEHVRRLLKPGGLIVFAVPNADKYTAWAKLHNIPPNQFAWWNKKSIQALLAKQNLSPITIASVGSVDPLDLVLGYLVSLGLYKKEVNFAKFDALASSEWAHKQKKSFRTTVRVSVKKCFRVLHGVSRALASLGIGRTHFFVVSKFNG